MLTCFQMCVAFRFLLSFYLIIRSLKEHYLVTVHFTFRMSKATFLLLFVCYVGACSCFCFLSPALVHLLIIKVTHEKTFFGHYPFRNSTKSYIHYSRTRTLFYIKHTCTRARTQTHEHKNLKTVSNTTHTLLESSKVILLN